MADPRSDLGVYAAESLAAEESAYSDQLSEVERTNVVRWRDLREFNADAGFAFASLDCEEALVQAGRPVAEASRRRLPSAALAQ